MSNQAAVVPALKRGIVEALGIEPVGSQHIVVQKNANGRLQGLSEDGPVLYLRMWDKHAELIREQIKMRENKGIFAFTSPVGQRIEATIKLQVDAEGSSDVVMGGPNDTQAEKDRANNWPVVRSDFPGYICSPMEKRVPTRTIGRGFENA